MEKEYRCQNCKSEFDNPLFIEAQFPEGLDNTDACPFCYSIKLDSKSFLESLENVEYEVINEGYTSILKKQTNYFPYFVIFNMFLIVFVLVLLLITSGGA